MIYKSNKRNRTKKTSKNKSPKEFYFDHKNFPKLTDKEKEQLKKHIDVWGFCRAHLGIVPFY